MEEVKASIDTGGYEVLLIDTLPALKDGDSFISLAHALITADTA